MKKIAVLIICTAMIIPFVIFNVDSAKFPSNSEYKKFMEEMINLAVKDMPTSGILASVTVAQSIQESTYGTSSMAQKAKNYFGIKASKSNWTGKVYIAATGYSTVYDSFDDAYNKIGADEFNRLYNSSNNRFFRVYASMEESVKDHGVFLNVNTRYSKMLWEEDYKTACQILSDAGYGGTDTYAAALTGVIEQYELYDYDSFEGLDVVKISIDETAVNLKVGSQHSINAKVIPSSAKNAALKYTSSDSTIATVSSSGVIKALKTGIATITVSSTNNKTETVTVYCYSTDELMYRGTTTAAVNCRTQPNTNTGSTVVGSFEKGAEVIIYGNAENGWYRVSGTGSGEKSISGYTYSSYISITGIYDPGGGETPSGVFDFDIRNATIINSDLNVRSGPGTTYEKLGVFTKGTQVYVLAGPANSSWYYIMGTAQGGKTVYGWAGGAYIDIGDSLITSRSSLAVNLYIDKYNYLAGFVPGTSAGDVKNMYSGVDVSVLDSNGKAVSDNTAVKTGFIINIKSNGNVIYEDRLIIKGDVTKTSNIGYLDYVNIRYHLTGIITLDGYALSAADVNNDGVVNAFDYINSRYHLLGIIDIYA